VEPIYVDTPNGVFVVLLSGKWENGNLKLNINISHGKLNILGKEYFVNNALVKVEGKRVYIELPLVYYAPDKTIYIKIYGYLPWQNLNMELYSVPPAPQDEILMAIISGSGGRGATLSEIKDIPIASLLLRAASLGVVGAINKLSSNIITGLKISLVPSFESTSGLVLGFNMEKDFGDVAKLGYRWVPSSNPKSTYLWGAVKFFYNSFLRFVRYSDGTISTNMRFSTNLGEPH